MSGSSDRPANSSGSGETASSPAIDQAGELRSVRVESLRAIGVLGVLVAHTLGWASYYGPEISQGAVDRAVALGTQASPFLLFVLSGCLLYGPFARRDLGRGDPINLRRYAINRVLRILPLYYAVLLVLFVFQERGGTLKKWVIYASFSQNFVASPNFQINRVMWYMVIELHFYLLLPLLAFLLARASGGSRGRAALFLVTLGLASYVFFMFAWHLDPVPNPFWRFSLLSTFFFLAAGMLLALIRLSWEEQRPGWLRGPLASADLWIAASAGLCALNIFWQFSLPSMNAMVIILLVSVLLVGACVLPLRAGPLVRVLEWRPLAVIGVASYSLYLWHDPVLKALAKSSWAPSGFVGLLAVGLPLCCLVAFASYALIEAPFLRLRRRWARSTPPHSGTPAGNRYKAPVRVPRTAALTTAAMVCALVVGILFAALNPGPSGQTDKMKTRGMAEGKILSPADGAVKAGATEGPLPGGEGAR
jgi:peptidoglycan/LPS O-acetylase OafA/YrhL